MTTLTAKRTLKHTAGLASVLLHMATPAAAVRRACVLLYHRVSAAPVVESRIDDWNVTPDTLERHIAWLAAHAELVFARDLPRRLATSSSSTRPIACLTFDDGFRNFHDEVVPLLRRYDARATVFVVTGYVGRHAPMPFDRWGLKHKDDAPAAAWRSMDWAEVERCAASGLVEVGGHSHHHYDAARTPPAALADEAATCRDWLVKKLGADHAASYAFPYGNTRLGQATPAYVAAVKAAGYSVAFTTDVGLATAESNPFTLPRVEVFRTDSPAVIRAKVGGALAPYHVTGRLRGIGR
ncbi:MAG: polysaccharide deacetylase family protein [Acidobacteria bacterium]|nr:polysaccharide deacetylase family protein [Acidobacteriota bacterium]